MSGSLPQQPPQMSDFEDVYKKIIIIGDGGVGKTTFITRIKEGYFIKNYIATVGADVYNIAFWTSNGKKLNYEVWDTAGQEINSVLSDVYYINSDAAICMFDVTSKTTFKNVNRWLMKLRTLTNNKDNEEIPTVVCGNKIDLKDRKVKASVIKSALSDRITAYYDISAKANHNFEKPFLEITRAILKDPSIEFQANFYLKPAELAVHPQHSQTEDISADILSAQSTNIFDDKLN